MQGDKEVANTKLRLGAGIGIRTDGSNGNSNNFGKRVGLGHGPLMLQQTSVMMVPEIPIYPQVQTRQLGSSTGIADLEAGIDVHQTEDGGYGAKAFPETRKVFPWIVKTKKRCSA